ncbi:hypothetical protein CDAR_561271 [Caerostris darwini]|uniref:Uncharacterized protein n=1 Tax=Caerostris darwini TaxID=1538125 RepID=A0AAV4SV56_9ARAC|nr:hypothetical protein CDAR_561271 [Caerostris darwini]
MFQEVILQDFVRQSFGKIANKDSLSKFVTVSVFVAPNGCDGKCERVCFIIIIFFLTREILLYYTRIFYRFYFSNGWNGIL